MNDIELSTATSLWVDLAILLICFLIIFFLEWQGCRRGKRTRTEWILLLTMLTGYLAIYIYLTFVYRRPLEQRQLLPRPFWSYENAFSFEGGLHIVHLSSARQILLNIWVYVPPGMMLPAAFYKSRHPYWMTVVACALLTLMTEGLQWLTRLGYCEVDDLIHNMTGALIGIWFYDLGSRAIRRMQKQRVQK